jgi:hypothetical protein
VFGLLQSGKEPHLGDIVVAASSSSNLQWSTNHDGTILRAVLRSSIRNNSANLVNISFI